MYDDIWSFWSWLDFHCLRWYALINGIHIFIPIVTLTFRPQICSPVALVQRYVSATVSYFEKIGGPGRMDGQTNGVQRIHNKCIASPWAYQETVAWWLTAASSVEYKLSVDFGDRQTEQTDRYTIRYDTIGEFNVDWKAEYSVLSSTRSQKKKLKQTTPVPL